jgi:hypothetical protein
VSTEPVILPKETTDVQSTSEKYTRTTRDSLLAIELAKESKQNAIYVGDSAKNSPAGLFNTPVSRLAIEHAISNAWIECGVLKHTLETTNEHATIRVPNAITEIVKEKVTQRTKTLKITISITTNRLTWGQKILVRIGKISLSVLVILALLGGMYLFKKRR